MASMPVLTPSRRAPRSIAVLAMAAALCGLSPPARANETWPAQVRATYRIEFGGFELGSFSFNAKVADGRYDVRGDARLSALLGAFKWQGLTHASGRISGSLAQPASYAFDFAGTGKSGAIRMGFQGQSVTNLANSPPETPKPDIVPVRREHLKGVIDPLSAVMLLSRGENGDPCAHRLPIFDGKQRFDLVLSLRGHERLAGRAVEGQPGVAYVCQVRYVPIAGHKQNEQTRALAASRGIEVALRPVPGANLFIPQRISVPTVAGTARIVVQNVTIVTPHNEQIALSH